MTTTIPPIAILTELAERAGEAILAIYNTDFSIYEKSDQSPLTEADMASHRVIVETLEELTPDIPVLSEESAAIPFSERSGWQRYWLIDPLDGTKEFIKRNGEFTVNIALIENQRAVLGIVHVPVSGVTFFGSEGNGAFRRTGNEEPEAISVCSQRRPTAKVAGSRSHAGESLQKFLTNLGDHEIVSMGSSLKLCLVAEGSADIYPRLGPTSEWDTAAAQAVVEAAGGKVTDTQMQPLRYNTKDSLLNPHFLVFGDDSVDWSRYLDSAVND
jgi:3'(2'), 5'-bisphosphate nucleotidase